MYQRKETYQRFLNKKGTAIEAKIMDHLAIEDVLIHQMKAAGFEVVTGEEKLPIIRRTWKDYLLKYYTLWE